MGLVLPFAISNTNRFDDSLKNLQQFLAELHTWAEECNWAGTLTITNDTPVDCNFLMEYGFLSQASIDIGVAAHCTIAGDVRCTIANTQLVIRSQMMFKCIKNSLTLAYLRTLINILPTFAQDGPKLIYCIITNMHIKLILSMHDLFQD